MKKITCKHELTQCDIDRANLTVETFYNSIKHQLSISISKELLKDIKHEVEKKENGSYLFFNEVYFLDRNEFVSLISLLNEIKKVNKDEVIDKLLNGIKKIIDGNK